MADLIYTHPLTGQKLVTNVPDADHADTLLKIINHLEIQGVIWLRDRNHGSVLIPTIEGKQSHKKLMAILKRTLPPDQYHISVLALCHLTQLSWTEVK